MVKYSKKATKTKKGKTVTKRVKASPTDKASLTKLIKNVTMKEAELKSKDYNGPLTQLNHNTYVSLGNPFSLCYPPQGSQDTERIGDTIQQRGVKVRMLITQKQDRMNVTFKLWLLKVPRGSTFTPSLFFDNTTGNTLLDSTNPDRVEVILSKTIKKYISPQLGTTAKEFTFPLSFYINRPKKITFASNATQVVGLTDDEYFLVITQFDAHGTLITDIIGSVQYFYRYYYKDL